MYPVSDVRFADANGSSIAYMVYGAGPPTVCAVPPMAQNIELAWESPLIKYMFDAFAGFSRQVVFDKRGTGMSDRSLAIPHLDERVDELKAVMDNAEVDRAFIHGLSEGGPMAIMFAATYPERVEGLILEGTGARLQGDERLAHLATPEGRAEADARFSAYASAWGTPHSMTTAIFAPSLLEDEEWTSWHPRYERQCANRDALTTLFEMNAAMDARGVLHRVDAPVLILHRIDDPVIPIERAREAYQILDAAGADVTMVETEGTDHFTFAGDVDSHIDAIEHFLTGRVSKRPQLKQPRVEITTLGRFEVRVDGNPVPTSEWGSKRARTLLKRLVVARGWPVTRDELFDLLWPDDASDRLGSRLSVQLSAVRRVLHGAVIADRETIRLDLEAVTIDVERWAGIADDEEIVAGYTGEFLPEDRFEGWSAGPRDEFQRRFVDAALRLAEGSEFGIASDLLRRVLHADHHNDGAHQRLIALLQSAGKLGAAREAYDDYSRAIQELGLDAPAFEQVISS